MADELYLIKGQTLTDIGDAIRQVSGSTSNIKVENFASEILNNIPTYYNVSFFNLTGTTPLARYKVENGGSVVYTGPTPTSEDTTLFFNGWDTDTSVITQTTTVWSNTKNLYQVTNSLSYEQGSHVSGYCQITGCTNQEFAIIPKYLHDGTEVASIIDGSGNVFGESLKTIVIGPLITIGQRAFNNCTNLQDIYFLGNKTQWDNTVRINFYGSTSSRQEGNGNFWLAPRIHTTDGCIINSFTDV